MKGIILCSLFLIVAICCSYGAPVETQPSAKKSARAVGASISTRVHIKPTSTKSYIDTHPHPKKRHLKRHHRLQYRRPRHKLIYPLKARLQYYGGEHIPLMPSAKAKHEEANIEMTNGEVFEHGGVPDLKSAMSKTNSAVKKHLTRPKNVVNKTNGRRVVSLEGDVDLQIKRLFRGSGDDKASPIGENFGDVIYTDNSTLFLFHGFGVDNKTDDRIRKLVKDVAITGNAVSPINRWSILPHFNKELGAHVSKMIGGDKVNGYKVETDTSLTRGNKLLSHDKVMGYSNQNVGNTVMVHSSDGEYHTLRGSKADDIKAKSDASTMSFVHDKVNNANQVLADSNGSILHDEVNGFKIDKVGIAFVNKLVDSMVRDKLTGRKITDNFSSDSSRSGAHNKEIKVRDDNKLSLNDKVKVYMTDDTDDLSGDSHMSNLHDDAIGYKFDKTSDDGIDSNRSLHVKGNRSEFDKVKEYNISSDANRFILRCKVKEDNVSVDANICKYIQILHDKVKEYKLNNASVKANRSILHDKVNGYKFNDAGNPSDGLSRSVSDDEVIGYKFDNTGGVSVDSNKSIAHGRVKGSEVNNTKTVFSNNSTTSEDQIIHSVSKFPPIKVHSDVGDFLMPDLHDIFSHNASINRITSHKVVSCKNKSEVTGPTQVRGELVYCEPIYPVSDEYTSETVGSDMVDNPNDYDNGSTWHNFGDNRDLSNDDKRVEKDSSPVNLIANTEDKSANGRHDINLGVSNQNKSSNETDEQKRLDVIDKDSSSNKIDEQKHLDVIDKDSPSKKTGEQELNIVDSEDNNSTNVSTVGYMDNDVMNEVLPTPTPTPSEKTGEQNLLDVIDKDSPSKKTGEQKLNISDAEDNNSTNVSTVGYMDNDVMTEVLPTPTNTLGNDTASAKHILQNETKDTDGTFIEGPLMTDKTPLPISVIPVQLINSINSINSTINSVDGLVGNDVRNYLNDDDNDYDDDHNGDDDGKSYIDFQDTHWQPRHTADNYADGDKSYEPSNVDSKPFQNQLYNSNSDGYHDASDTFDNPNLTGHMERPRNNVDDHDGDELNINDEQDCNDSPLGCHRYFYKKGKKEKAKKRHLKHHKKKHHKKLKFDYSI